MSELWNETCSCWLSALGSLIHSNPDRDGIPEKRQGFPFKMCSMWRRRVRTASCPYCCSERALRRTNTLPASDLLSAVASWLLQKLRKAQFISWILPLYCWMGINMPKRHWSFSADCKSRDDQLSGRHLYPVRWCPAICSHRETSVGPRKRVETARACLMLICFLSILDEFHPNFMLFYLKSHSNHRNVSRLETFFIEKNVGWEFLVI